jgi:hypothetical protein
LPRKAVAASTDKVASAAQPAGVRSQTLAPSQTTSLKDFAIGPLTTVKEVGYFSPFDMMNEAVLPFREDMLRGKGFLYFSARRHVYVHNLLNLESVALI